MARLPSEPSSYIVGVKKGAKERVVAGVEKVSASLLTAQCSLLTAHCSLLTDYYSVAVLLGGLIVRLFSLLERKRGVWTMSRTACLSFSFVPVESWTMTGHADGHPCSLDEGQV